MQMLLEADGETNIVLLSRTKAFHKVSSFTELLLTTTTAVTFLFSTTNQLIVYN